MAHTDDGYVHQEADSTRQLQQQQLGGQRQDHESLLVKAMEIQKDLEVPTLQPSTNSSQECLSSSNGSGSMFEQVLTPHHSDFTIRTNNLSDGTSNVVSSPPNSVPFLQHQHQQRRTVLGSRVKQRYKGTYMLHDNKQNVQNMNNMQNNGAMQGNKTSQIIGTEGVLSHAGNSAQTQQSTHLHVHFESNKQGNTIYSNQNDIEVIYSNGDDNYADFVSSNNNSNNNSSNNRRKRKISDNSDIDSPPSSPLVGFRPVVETNSSDIPILSPLTPNRTGSHQQPMMSSPSPNTQTQYNDSHRSYGSHNASHRSTSSSTRPKKVHETIHAQSLLLAFAFMAIWSPSNIMAPNLTQIAEFFNMSDSERDLYLGSYCALAAGVFGFPISALIGVATDLYSRKILFVGTAVGGALSSCFTGLSENYAWLFFARLLNGGFMSASVPIAFSLLGDLFATEERNAASSGLTAMMGLGIIVGQVYSGLVGETLGWSHPFYASCAMTLFLALLVSLLIREPVRGGKEKVLQDMLKQGTKYEKKLTWDGFIHAMRHNTSNQIIMWQGFFSSLPWGIIFVFLNDYLSQERGFSVADATYIVFLFGVGCAVGGILGGYYGALFQSWNRSYLPLFMSATTFLGIFPFLGLLDTHTTNAHGYIAMGYSILAGIIASLPSVNVRPCLINVNPPETRGAALTAANLIINLARGIGPSCVTTMTAIWRVDRKFSFNVALIVFWTICSIQLLFLAKSLPEDQDRMEAELAEYANNRILTAKREKKAACTTRNNFQGHRNHFNSHLSEFDDTCSASLVSIEERMTSFDGVAARESLSFVRKGIKEMQFGPFHCVESSSSDDDYYDEYEDNERNNNFEEAGVTSTSSSEYEQQNRVVGNKNVNDANTFTRQEPHTETTHLLV